MFFKIGDLKKFRNIHRKAPLLDSFLKKVGGLQICNFIQKETPTQVFSCEYYEIFKNTLFYRTPPIADSGACEKSYNCNGILQLSDCNQFGSES